MGAGPAASEDAGLAHVAGLRQAGPSNRPLADAFSDSTPCNTGLLGKYGIYAPSVAQASYAQTTIPPGTVMVTPNANTAASIVTIMNRGVGDNAGIIPAGLGDVGYNDRPIDYALIDARNAAVAAMTADTAANRPCRNTVVVLITSGKDDGNAAYNAAHNPATTAATFLSVTASGVTHRIPIHVLAINPAAADEAELQSIATSSAGRYQKVTHAAEITRSINYAVQQGFARSSDFDSSKASEYLPVSPIVGTVNLVNAKDSIGNSLPNTEITADPGGQDLPQRSNVLITAGFSLPGFDGRLRAFRAYKPETDSTKPTGWKFVGDNTKLWRDLDGRPTLAGLARTPADPNSRNIYTYVPDGSGGGSVVAFTTANAATLTAHMGVGANTSLLISSIRSLPLGAIIGSTPALMDPPSLDPAPDTDYGRSDAPGSFAADHKDRRSIIFFGANDGMIHARGRTDGIRSLGVHPLQPAAEAPDARRRSAGRAVRLLRGQLAQTRGSEDQRRLAQHPPHRSGQRRNVLSGVRRHESRHGSPARIGRPRRPSTACSRNSTRRTSRSPSSGRFPTTRASIRPIRRCSPCPTERPAARSRSTATSRRARHMRRKRSD